MGTVARTVTPIALYKDGTNYRFSLTHFKKVKSQSSILFQGSVLWNSVPIAIRNSSSLNLFKRSFKSHLLGLVN